jgi:hypothetical protein
MADAYSSDSKTVFHTFKAYVRTASMWFDEIQRVNREGWIASHPTSDPVLICAVSHHMGIFAACSAMPGLPHSRWPLKRRMPLRVGWFCGFRWLAATSRRWYMLRQQRE